MRVLILSERFPPFQDPRALRWGAIATHWARMGWDVHVLCRSHDGLSRDERWCGAWVHRVACGRMGALTQRMQTALRPATTGSPLVAQSPAVQLPFPRSAAKAAKSVAMRSAIALRNATWQQLWWPDYACLWQRWAFARAVTLFGAAPPDALVSVSNPYSDHATALRLHELWPRTWWLADIGDPFTTEAGYPVNATWLYRRANERLERRVLQQANRLSVTNRATQRAYQRAYGEVADKMQVIPPLLSLPARDLNRRATNDGVRRLVFTGTLYPGLRSPGPLLKLFAELVRTAPDRAAPHRKWELHFYGRSDACRDEFAPYQAMLGDSIHLHRQVPRATVADALFGAHLLVNLGNDNPCQLPSKLVEYLAAGKPILNLAVRTDDTSSEFLETHRAALTITTRECESPGGLQRALEFMRRPPTSLLPHEIAQAIEPYRAEQLAKEYAELVRPVVTDVPHAMPPAPKHLAVTSTKSPARNRTETQP